MDFVEKEAIKYPDLASEYLELGQLHSKRLWHQLTEKLCEFVLKPSNRRDSNLVDLYEHFLSTFASKLSKFKVVQVVAVMAQQLLKSSPTPAAKEFDAAIAFLSAATVDSKSLELNKEASVIARMAISELEIRCAATLPKDSADALVRIEKVKQSFEEVREDMRSLEGSGIETVVNSSFYRVLAEYHKVVGPADDFYNASLQFLAYTPLDSLEPEVQKNLAIDMSLAALVGEGVFNFGEVLAQPILATLDNTPNAWLHELLKVYSAGDIGRFNDLYSENKAAFESQAVLVANMELLRQKLALLCLMQIVFLRPPEERTITFTDIAESTKLSVDQVEWLLMRAMSRGLIKGRIDEILGVINVTWLKPRVLDTSQMSMLQGKLEKWTKNVGDTLSFIESETPELFQ